MGLFDPYPAQDIFYGMNRQNLALRLTEDNWESKAIIRILKTDDALSWVYCWIRQRKEKGEIVYHARFHSLSSAAGLGVELDAPFVLLSDALSYINGADGSLVSQLTRPARKSEWPPDEAPASMVSGTGTKS